MGRNAELEAAAAANANAANADVARARKSGLPPQGPPPSVPLPPLPDMAMSPRAVSPFGQNGGGSASSHGHGTQTTHATHATHATGGAEQASASSSYYSHGTHGTHVSAALRDERDSASLAVVPDLDAALALGYLPANVERMVLDLRGERDAGAEERERLRRAVESGKITLQDAVSLGGAVA
jgi:kinesin family protein 4/21/27